MLVFGYVDDEPFHGAELPHGGENPDALLPDPLHLALLRDDAVDDLEVLLGAQPFLNLAPHPVLLIGVNYLPVGDPAAPGQLVGRVTRESQAPLAHELHGPGRVVPAAIHHAREVPEEGEEHSALLLQVVFGLLAGRLIAEHRDDLSGRELVDEVLPPPGNPLFLVVDDGEELRGPCPPHTSQRLEERAFPQAGKELEECLPDDLFPREVIDPLRCPVEIDELEILPFTMSPVDGHPVQGVLDYAAVAALRLHERLLGKFPFRDVDGHGQDVRPACVLDDLREEQAVVNPAGGMPDRDLPVLHKPLFPELGHQLRPAVRFRPDIDRGDGLSQEVLLRVPGEPQIGVVRINDDAFVYGGDGRGDGVQEKTPAKQVL